MEYISLCTCIGTFCLCILSASAFMHRTIPTSARICLEIFYGDLFLFFFDKICYAVPPTHMRLMRHPHMCAPMDGFQQPVHSARSVFPAKSAGCKSQLCSKQSSNEPSPENFLTIGDYFEHYMYRVMALGWLKKEEEEEEKDEQ